MYIFLLPFLYDRDFIFHFVFNLVPDIDESDFFFGLIESKLLIIYECKVVLV